VVFFFQNCGQSTFEMNDDQGIISSNAASVTRNTAPVAFEVGLDSITYNSCVPNNRGAGGLFTLQISAGGTRGGVRLTPSFLQTAQSQLTPILGNAQVLDVQYKQLLEQTNPNIEFQVALRSSTDYRAYFDASPNSAPWGRMDYLSHDSWLTPLVESARRNNNQFVPYSPRAPSMQPRIQSRIDYSFLQNAPAADYWSGLASAGNFRVCLAQGCSNTGRFAIAAGFSEAGNPNVIRGPTAVTNSAQTSAYGRGYFLQFGYPDNRPEAGLRVVKGIQEFNMQNQQPVSDTVNGPANAWDCTEIPIMSSLPRGPANNQQTAEFDQADAAGARAALCNPMRGDFAVQNFTALRLAKIREILPPQHWRLGYQVTPAGTRLCAVPVGFDCYPNEPFQNFNAQTGQSQPFPFLVAYTPGVSCLNEDNFQAALANVGNQISRVCGHYITVCLKR